MKRTILTFIRGSIWVLACAALTVGAAEPKKILVVTVTTEFRHSSIATAEKILAKLAKESGAFTVDFVQQPEEQVRKPAEPKADADEDAKAKFKEALAKYEGSRPAFEQELKDRLSKLSADNLKNYDGLIFANTTGDLPVPDPQAIVDWVKQGRAFIGMHSASDTYHHFRPYIEMLGGEFAGHGQQARVECTNEDKKHPATKHLPQNWSVFDEIYIFKNFAEREVHGLLTLDREPNKMTPGDFPVAWCRDFGKGRVFYTSLGHREDMWDEDTPAGFKRQNGKDVAAAYQKHVLAGIKWALGLEKGNAKPNKR